MPVLQDRPYPVRVEDASGETLIERMGARISELSADERADGQYRTTDIPRTFRVVLTPITEQVVTRTRLHFGDRVYVVTGYRDEGFTRFITAVA